MKPAVVLLSGGLESATVCAMARADGFSIHALTIAYGQRHEVEIAAAKRVASALGCLRHQVMHIDLRAFGGSALTSDAPVPKDRAAGEISEGIPVTYVPARNTVFLSLALGFAEASGVHDIFLGVNAVDYSGYPDCRPEFIAAFEKLANLATRDGVEGRSFRIHAPLVSLRKTEIIARGLELGLDYSLTHSCYDPDREGRACGRCDSCQIRGEAFRELGLIDPALAPGR